jgi:hypothetical protein
MLDLIPSQTHGEGGNRDSDTTACRSGACNPVRSDRQGPGRGQPVKLPEQRLSGRISNGRREPRMKATPKTRARHHATRNHQTAIPAGEQEPSRTGRSWSAVRFLPRARLGIAFKRQSTAACRAVGQSPAKQGGLRSCVGRPVGMERAVASGSDRQRPG